MNCLHQEAAKQEGKTQQRKPQRGGTDACDLIPTQFPILGKLYSEMSNADNKKNRQVLEQVQIFKQHGIQIC